MKLILIFCVFSLPIIECSFSEDLTVTGYDCSDISFIRNISLTEISTVQKFESVTATPGVVQIMQEIHSSQVRK